MTDCQWEQLLDGRLRCVRCGFETRKPFPLNAQRNCPSASPAGLGDTIAAITAALRIPHCGGCERRRRWLNRLLPYRRG